MKKLISIAFLLLCLFDLSCKKSHETSPTVTPVIDEDKLFLQDVQSDAAAEYFVSGDFDGYSIYCATTYGNLYPGNDSNMNTIYVSDTSDLDQMNVIRENADLTVTIALYFTHANIFAQPLP